MEQLFSGKLRFITYPLMVILWIIIPFTGVAFFIYFVRKKVRSKKLRMSLYSLAGLVVLFGISMFVTGDVDKSLEYLRNFNSEKQVAGVTTETKTQHETVASVVLPEFAVVTRVIDGDTIELENGETVRYIGINTPETVDPRRSVECFGEEASQKNKELVLNKTVRLEKDISDTDRYGRYLRYVYIGDVMVNEVLVSEGFAFSSSYPPDIKYQDVFHEAENDARENNRGLWEACDE